MNLDAFIRSSKDDAGEGVDDFEPDNTEWIKMEDKDDIAMLKKRLLTALDVANNLEKDLRAVEEGQERIEEEDETTPRELPELKKHPKETLEKVVEQRVREEKSDEEASDDDMDAMIHKFFNKPEELIDEGVLNKVSQITKDSTDVVEVGLSKQIEIEPAREEVEALKPKLHKEVLKNKDDDEEMQEKNKLSDEEEVFELEKKVEEDVDSDDLV